jgi:hypothetical protein
MKNEAIVYVFAALPAARSILPAGLYGKDGRFYAGTLTDPGGAAVLPCGRRQRNAARRCMD